MNGDHIDADVSDAYVRAALRLHGYSLDDAQERAVAAQFGRIAAIARTMLDAGLPDDSEPAALFRP